MVPILLRAAALLANLLSGVAIGLLLGYRIFREVKLPQTFPTPFSPSRGRAITPPKVGSKRTAARAARRRAWGQAIHAVDSARGGAAIASTITPRSGAEVPAGAAPPQAAPAASPTFEVAAPPTTAPAAARILESAAPPPAASPPSTTREAELSREVARLRQALAKSRKATLELEERLVEAAFSPQHDPFADAPEYEPSPHRASPSPGWRGSSAHESSPEPGYGPRRRRSMPIGGPREGRTLSFGDFPAPPVPVPFSPQELVTGA